MLNASVSGNATAPDPGGGSGSDVDACQQDAWVLECVTRRLWQILAPVIIVVGLLGNLLVVIVFSRLHFSKSSTLVHMFVLAITDSVILCLGPTRYWARNTFDFDIRGISHAGCKLHLFLLYTTLDYSAWILVSVTVERALSVLRPLHVLGWFTVRRTLIRLSVILVVIFCINGHYFFSNGLVADKTNEVSSEDDIITPSYTNSTSISEAPVSNSADLNSSAHWYSTVTSWTAIQTNGSVVSARWAGREALVLEASTTKVAQNSTSEVKLTAAPFEGALYSPSAVTAGYPSTKMECDSLTPEWENFEEYTFVYIDMCVESFFPFVVMAVCNSFIVTSLRHAKKNRPRNTTRRGLQLQQQQLSAVVESVTRRARTAPLAPHTDQYRSSLNGHAVHLANGDSVHHLHVRSAKLRARADDGESELFDKNEPECKALAKWRDKVTSLHGGASAPPAAPSLASTLLQSQSRPKLSDQSESNSLSTGVTRMLVLVTTVFLLATLPAALFFIIDSYLRNYQDDDAYVNKALDLTQAVTNLLQYSNYGCNFLLYSMHSKRFLREVKFMFGLVNGRFRRHFNSSVLSKGTLHDSNTRSRLSTQRRYQPSTRNLTPALCSVSEAEAEDRLQEWVSGSSNSAADSSSGGGPGEGPRKPNGHLPQAVERKPRSGTDVTYLSNSLLASGGGDPALLRRGSGPESGQYPVAASVTSAGSNASLQSEVKQCDVASDQRPDGTHAAVSIYVSDAGACCVKYRRDNLPQAVSGEIDRDCESAVVVVAKTVSGEIGTECDSAVVAETVSYEIGKKCDSAVVAKTVSGEIGTECDSAVVAETVSYEIGKKCDSAVVAKTVSGEIGTECDSAVVAETVSYEIGKKCDSAVVAKTVSGEIGTECDSAVVAETVMQNLHEPCGRHLEQETPSENLPDQADDSDKLETQSNATNKVQSVSDVSPDDKLPGAVRACDQCGANSLQTESKEPVVDALESLQVRLQSASPGRRPLKHTITRIVGNERSTKPEQTWQSKRRRPGILSLFSSTGLKHCRRRKKKSVSLPSSELLSQGVDSISDRVSCAESNKLCVYCRAFSDSSKSDQGSSADDSRNIVCVRI